MMVGDGAEDVWLTRASTCSTRCKISKPKMHGKTQDALTLSLSLFLSLCVCLFPEPENVKNGGVACTGSS